MELMGRWGCENQEPKEACTEMEEWVNARKGYLPESPAPPNHPPQEVDLSFLHAKDHGDNRPWTVVQLGDMALWGMIDTGAFSITFRSDQKGLANTFELLGKPYSYVSPWGSRDVHQSAVLSRFTLGSVVESPVPALVIDDANDGYRDAAIVGTSVLLRYQRICFDWANRKLHLGRLGTCAEGVQLSEVGLRSGVLPVVRVHAPDGAPFDVMLDTGSHSTLCQERFVERMGGRRFRFGSHPEFDALCVDDSKYELRSAAPEEEGYDLPALIGMDTLMKFDGFGWELNPFRVYLVPKSDSKP